ncbi:MAG: hypothetical protein DI640_15210, partial [Sphingomonas taxi]
LGGAGAVVAHRDGVPNAPGLSALFDLMTMDERRALLGAVVPRANARGRGEPLVSAAQVRAHLKAGLESRHGAASASFWAWTKGRAVVASDLRVLHSVAVRVAA